MPTHSRWLLHASSDTFGHKEWEIMSLVRAISHGADASSEQASGLFGPNTHYWTLDTKHSNHPFHHNIQQSARITTMWTANAQNHHTLPHFFLVLCGNPQKSYFPIMPSAAYMCAKCVGVLQIFHSKTHNISSLFFFFFSQFKDYIWCLPTHLQFATCDTCILNFTVQTPKYCHSIIIISSL